MYSFDKKVIQRGFEMPSSFEGMMSLQFLPRALRKEKQLQETRQSVLCHCSRYSVV